MFRTTAVVTSIISGLLIVAPAHAGTQVCGHYVFGGAYPSESAALNKANSLPWSPEQTNGPAMALDLRTSNSPNNKKKLFVVALGPFDLKSEADKWVKQWKKSGVKGAYTANRCFTGV